MGEFPEGPRLELCAFIAIGPGSVPGQVTKIPKARVCGPKRKVILKQTVNCTYKVINNIHHRF